MRDDAKTCKKCGKSKPIEEYRMRGFSRDNVCRECRRYEEAKKRTRKRRKQSSRPFWADDPVNRQTDLCGETYSIGTRWMRVAGKY